MKTGTAGPITKISLSLQNQTFFLHLRYKLLSINPSPRLRYCVKNQVTITIYFGVLLLLCFLLFFVPEYFLKLQGYSKELPQMTDQRTLLVMVDFLTETGNALL
jgi:hypothetical protein